MKWAYNCISIMRAFDGQGWRASGSILGRLGCGTRNCREHEYGLLIVDRRLLDRRREIRWLSVHGLIKSTEDVNLLQKAEGATRLM